MEIIENNPFRVLGLPVTATEREIAKQINTLATYAEMGKAKTFDTDFPFLPAVNRTPEAIEEAKKKIEQSENKMFYSLFWFWKNNAVDEQALNALKEGNTDKAFEIWENSLFAEKKLVHKLSVIHDNLILSSESWSGESDADHTLKKNGGSYTIDRKKETSTSIPCVPANLDDSIPNWSIEADTTWELGVENIGYGIIFGRDKGNYFSFDISADGHYSYSKYVDWAYEKKISWTASAAIRKNGSNHLQIKKVDGFLNFIINGTLVDTFKADPFYGKLLGFKVTNNQKVTFSNLKVASLVADNSYGAGVNVTEQNYSSIKNLSVLRLAISVKDGNFNEQNFIKGLNLANLFFSDNNNINAYARTISGERAVYNAEKTFSFFINDLAESTKDFIDKPKGMSLGNFIQAFSTYPVEAKQYLQSRFLAGPIQNVEKAIEACGKSRRNNAEGAVQEGKNLIDKTSNDIQFLKKCSGENDVQYQIIADKLSSEVVQCGIDYFNQTKNDEPCLPLYQYAVSIAGSIRAKEKAKENLDSCNEWMQNRHLYNCWFCGKNQPVEASKLAHTIYKVNSRGYRSVQYSYVPINIPRCTQCKQTHSKGNDKLALIIAGIGVLGLIVGYLVDEHFIIGAAVGAGVGAIVGAAVKSSDFQKAGIKSTSTSTLRTYPVISKMLREGWQMHKPSA